MVLIKYGLKLILSFLLGSVSASWPLASNPTIAVYEVLLKEETSFNLKFSLKGATDKLTTLI